MTQPVEMIPDLAQKVYESVGINQPDVSLAGYTASVADLRPGDLVGWHGGYQPDGTYAGNVAVYVGNREILESQFGQTRRRKIHNNENVFGMPVSTIDDEVDV